MQDALTDTIPTSTELIEAAEKHARTIHGKGHVWSEAGIRTMSDFVAGAVWQLNNPNPNEKNNSQ